ncbi:NUDIX domain-containing protein [Paraburkholderia bannensis]|uniref:NUDIX domain-containing protein n=1 Tax=Paraburkholderia bannensis TaxID=765414 RepID=UPI002AB680B6|nr:NUDIX domain-containing protein [Paraburkholderia bannensis]
MRKYERRATAVCWQREKILLVERGRSRWSLPGGTIWRDETPTEAVHRQLGEETAFEGCRLDYLFQFGGLNKCHHAFFCVSPDDSRPHPCDEISRCRWLWPRKAATLPASVPTREIVALLFELDCVASGLDFGRWNARAMKATFVEPTP